MIEDELWQGDPVRRVIEYAVVLDKPVTFMKTQYGWSVYVGDIHEAGTYTTVGTELNETCKHMCQQLMRP